MNGKRNTFKGMRLLLPLVGVVALLSACASIGRPEGGPRDIEPPVYVRSNPAPGAVRFNKNNIEIYFNENVKVEDVMNKVVVSPAQKQTPQISANGRRLTALLRDSLLPNTTYTIDFSDAIRDLNEGNILDGFALDFATGDTIDTLRISGMVLQASNLEPAQGMLVGVYDNLDDSAITTLPMLRIAKTNQLGQFTIRNLKPGTYNVFALNDMNRDYHWDRSEDIAFYPEPVTPTVENITVIDTLRAADGSDSIVTRPGVKYLPNDILLTWFNEEYVAQYLKDYQRADSNRISITMATKADSLPRLTIVNGPNAGRRLDTPDASVLNHSATLDTLDYWIVDPAIISQDSLLIATEYMRTDTLDNLSWTSDTLKFYLKASQKAKPEKKKKKKKDDEEDADTVPKLTFTNLTIGGNPQEVFLPLMVKMEQPVSHIVPHTWHLEELQDSNWIMLPEPVLKQDTTGRVMNYSISHDWKMGTKYRLSVDSASVHTVYGLFNKPVKQEFSVRAAEEYSTIIFNLKGVPDSVPVMVQLLSSSDAPVRTVKAVGNVAKFEYILPGTYYARAWIDNDSNGVWTTGNVQEHRLPEDVYYFAKKINLKKNWDVSNDWDLNELAVDMQKPTAIKKNKPKTRDKNQTRDYDDEEEEEDEYDDMGRPGYDNRNPFDDNRNRGRGTSNRTGNTQMRQTGGMRR